VLHFVVVVNERVFPLLFCIVFWFEAGLAQGLSGRVVHFDPTGASAGGKNGLGVDFVKFILLVL